ncbi:MAG: galactosamine-6-phosphate isomerase [Saprospiraceae bacterium]
MKISYFNDYNALSEAAKKLILNTLEIKKNSLLCAATGNSPLKTYQLLVEYYNKNPDLFSALRLLKLDEWGGVPMDDPQTCESFLQENLVKPLKISSERYLSFRSDAADPQLECKRMQNILDTQSTVDLCILGLGKNGHIGFNEPAAALTPHCHVAKLTADSMQHSMAQAMQQKPTYGITLGIKDILQAKKIILLVTGSNKKQIMQQLLHATITTYLPASFLWLHNDVECLVDKNVLA